MSAITDLQHAIEKSDSRSTAYPPLLASTWPDSDSIALDRSQSTSPKTKQTLDNRLEEWRKLGRQLVVVYVSRWKTLHKRSADMILEGSFSFSEMSTRLSCTSDTSGPISSFCFACF